MNFSKYFQLETFDLEKSLMYRLVRLLKVVITISEFFALWFKIGRYFILCNKCRDTCFAKFNGTFQIYQFWLRFTNKYFNYNGKIEEKTMIEYLQKLKQTSWEMKTQTITTAWVHPRIGVVYRFLHKSIFWTSRCSFLVVLYYIPLYPHFMAKLFIAKMFL